MIPVGKYLHRYRQVGWRIHENLAKVDPDTSKWNSGPILRYIVILTSIFLHSKSGKLQQLEPLCREKHPIV